MRFSISAAIVAALVPVIASAQTQPPFYSDTIVAHFLRYSTTSYGAPNYNEIFMKIAGIKPLSGLKTYIGDTTFDRHLPKGPDSPWNYPSNSFGAYVVPKPATAVATSGVNSVPTGPKGLNNAPASWTNPPACDEGRYYNTAKRECELCPDGTYAYPPRCPSGQRFNAQTAKCVAGAIGAGDFAPVACQPCDKDHYCAGGVRTACPSLGATAASGENPLVGMLRTKASDCLSGGCEGVPVRSGNIEACITSCNGCCSTPAETCWDEYNKTGNEAAFQVCYLNYSGVASGCAGAKATCKENCIKKFFNQSDCSNAATADANTCRSACDTNVETCIKGLPARFPGAVWTGGTSINCNSEACGDAVGVCWNAYNPCMTACGNKQSTESSLCYCKADYYRSAAFAAGATVQNFCIDCREGLTGCVNNILETQCATQMEAQQKHYNDWAEQCFYKHGCDGDWQTPTKAITCACSIFANPGQLAYCSAPTTAQRSACQTMFQNHAAQVGNTCYNDKRSAAEASCRAKGCKV